MNVNRQIGSFRPAGLWLLVPLSLLTLPATTYAGSREAVQNAIAATVTVEWRAHEKADPQPSEQNKRARQAPDTGAQAEETGGSAVGAGIRWLVSRSADLTLASGVVVSANGLVVTSNQEPDGHYDVIFADGRSLPARVVVDDRRSGLRLLKVDATDLPHLTLADADAEIGDHVFAAFATDRHDRAAAQGMVAARQKSGALELDLAAGTMSAGGPLVNEQGGLVGVLLGRSAPEGRAQTGSSAVPLKDIRALLAVQQGENTVVAHRGFLGVSLDSKPEGGRERVILHLLTDSPARDAGLLDGDELISVAGEKITSMEQAAGVVGRHSPGEKILVVVSRDGQEKSLEITVGRSPAALESAQNARGGSRGTRGTVAAKVVRPEKVYILSEDGKPVPVPADGQQIETLRQALRFTAERPYRQPEPATGTIRVERSDLDKKLEEVGRSVESLQEQVKKLTEEIQALRSKLAEAK
ncbi:MAG TPA: trypsin-like peptidase domain-containing protein [Pirellulales bacterium]|nr:trypsin-like peptidase domain-containing protein [Pirellulales bacterium]